MMIREPVVAGAFYPGDKDELKDAVEKYTGDAKVEELEPVKGRATEWKVRAVIAPHAGYIYSGPTAGYAYAAVKGSGIDTVFRCRRRNRN